MKTISSIIITISLLLAMTMCTLQVNAYHHGRDLRPVNNNRNRNDGSLRFQQTGATGTDGATGSETGGAQTEKTKDEVLDKKEEQQCIAQIKSNDPDKPAKIKRCHDMHQPRCPPPKNCWFAFLGMCKGEIKQPGVPCKHAEKKKPKVDDSEPEADSPGTGPEASGSGASGPEESGASGDDESGSESGASGPEKDDESGPAAAKKF